jgi:malic enzyme
MTIPADVFRWTEGRALMVTGSPFDPVDYDGKTLQVSQGNNVYVFPGVGLGAIVSQASQVTDGMLATAAHELAAMATEEDMARAMLYPPLADLRAITRVIARAVAIEACESGVAEPMTPEEIDKALDLEIWDLDYPTLRPI